MPHPRPQPTPTGPLSSPGSTAAVTTRPPESGRVLLRLALEHLGGEPQDWWREHHPASLVASLIPVVPLDERLLSELVEGATRRLGDPAAIQDLARALGSVLPQQPAAMRALLYLAGRAAEAEADASLLALLEPILRAWGQPQWGSDPPGIPDAWAARAYAAARATGQRQLRVSLVTAWVARFGAGAAWLERATEDLFVLRRLPPRALAALHHARPTAATWRALASRAPRRLCWPEGSRDTLDATLQEALRAEIRPAIRDQLHRWARALRSETPAATPS